MYIYIHMIHNKLAFVCQSKIYAPRSDHQTATAGAVRHRRCNPQEDPEATRFLEMHPTVDIPRYIYTQYIYNTYIYNINI